MGKKEDMCMGIDFGWLFKQVLSKINNMEYVEHMVQNQLFQGITDLELFDRVLMTVLQMLLRCSARILLVASAFAQSNQFDSKFRGFPFHLLAEEHFDQLGGAQSIEEKKTQLKAKFKEEELVNSLFEQIVYKNISHIFRKVKNKFADSLDVFFTPYSTLTQLEYFQLHGQVHFVVAGIEVMFHSTIKEAIIKFDISSKNSIFNLDNCQVLDVAALTALMAEQPNQLAQKGADLEPNLFLLCAVMTQRDSKGDFGEQLATYIQDTKTLSNPKPQQNKNNQFAYFKFCPVLDIREACVSTREGMLGRKAEMNVNLFISMPQQFQVLIQDGRTCQDLFSIFFRNQEMHESPMLKSPDEFAFQEDYFKLNFINNQLRVVNALTAQLPDNHLYKSEIKTNFHNLYFCYNKSDHIFLKKVGYVNQVNQLKNFINVRKQIDSAHLIKYLAAKQEEFKYQSKNEFTVTLKMVMEQLHEASYLRPTNYSTTRLIQLEVEFNTDWNATLLDPHNAHIKHALISFLVLLKFTENMEYYDPEKRDLKDLYKPLLKIFSGSEQDILFTQTALFVELVGCNYFKAEFLDKLHPTTTLRDNYKTNVQKVPDKEKFENILTHTCSEQSMKSNIEGKLLFILMCMVSTTQGTFQYKKTDSIKVNIVPHKVDEHLFLVRKYLNFLQKRVRMSLDTAIVEVLADYKQDDVKTVLDRLNVFNVKDQYPQNNLNVFMGLVMKQYLYSHERLAAVVEDWRHAVVEGEQDFKNGVQLLRNQIRKCFMFVNEYYRLGKEAGIKPDQLKERKLLLNQLNKIKNILVQVHSKTKIFKEKEEQYVD